MGTNGGYFGITNNGISYEELQNQLCKVALEDDAVIAWNSDARWLPYFDESFHENISPNPKGAKHLSEKLGFPVLIFSIFDSDVLFLYYCDAKSGILESRAKSNVGPVWSVFVEDPAEANFFPSETLPDFLLPLCDEKS